MCVEGVGAAVVSGLDSGDSPSALSVSRAHSTDQPALEEPPRCSRASRLYNHAVAAAEQLRCAGRTRAGGAGAAVTSERVCGRHSVIA